MASDYSAKNGLLLFDSSFENGYLTMTTLEQEEMKLVKEIAVTSCPAVSSITVVHRAAVKYFPKFVKQN